MREEPRQDIESHAYKHGQHRRCEPYLAVADKAAQERAHQHVIGHGAIDPRTEEKQERCRNGRVEEYQQEKADRIKRRAHHEKRSLVDVEHEGNARSRTAFPN